MDGHGCSSSRGAGSTEGTFKSTLGQPHTEDSDLLQRHGQMGFKQSYGQKNGKLECNELRPR